MAWPACVGYKMAALEKIEEIERFGLGSYAANQAGVAGAVASYNDHKFLEYSNKIWEARDEQRCGQEELPHRCPLPDQLLFKPAA